MITARKARELANRYARHAGRNAILSAMYAGQTWAHIHVITDEFKQELEGLGYRIHDYGVSVPYTITWHDE